MRRRLALLLALATLLTGCATGPGQGRDLTVLAAASLTEPFDELAGKFRAEHPGVRVRIDYQGSAALAEQIKLGRRAGVFAPANRRNMREVARAGLTATEPRVFATNRLIIAVPRGNPAGITSFRDLARPGVALVMCAPPVPCGAAAAEAERAAGVRLGPVSEENDVKAVLRKVVAGEADAGLVYVTDVRSAGPEVRGIPFPAAAGAVNSYPVAALEDAENPELAREFVRFVRGATGRAVLARYGFGAP